MIRRLLPLVIVITACTAGTRTTQTTLYLTELEPISRNVNYAIADARIAIDRLYDSDDLFVIAIVDTRLRTRIAIQRDLLRRIEPSPGFEEDHAEYESLLDHIQDLAADLDAALAEPPDRAQAAVAGARLESEAALGFSKLSAQMCRFAAFELSLCAEDEFYSESERAAHEALERAAAVFNGYSYIPASVPAESVISVGEEIANTVGDELRESAATIEGVGGDDTRMQMLAGELRMLATEVDRLVDRRFSRGVINERLALLQSEICRLAPEFPDPEPLRGEGGALVQIAGFADVWFTYAGRCEA